MKAANNIRSNAPHYRYRLVAKNRKVVSVAYHLALFLQNL